MLATANLVHGNAEADIRKVITKGVPGSQMPGFGQFEEDELASLVAFVKSLAGGSGGAEKAKGDAAAGRLAYEKNRCGMCHRINSEGSVYGPDLSRAGSGRSLAYLRESILDPSADIPNESRGVTVTQNDGVVVSGVRLNEDAYSIQLRDIGQRFRMFEKGEVKSVQEMKKSLMPAYSLPQDELENLVAYLASLKGAAEQGKDAKKAEGVH